MTLGSISPTLILADVAAFETQWSPYGSRIVFGGNGLNVIHADGTNLRQITTTDTPGIDAQPSWAPDGTQYAFVTDRDEGNVEIYVMNADGSNQTRITNNPGRDTTPAWSPDGSKIVFASERDGGELEIYTVNANGSNPTRLTHFPLYNFLPSWSPDGQWIAFSHNTTERGCAQLYVIRPDGTDMRQLDEDLCELWMIDWLLDSSRVVYQDYAIVYMIDVAGSNQTILADFSTYSRVPGPVDLHQLRTP
ncbi:MAG: hypothetical protein K8L99_29075 [Anaerolineae bacterium]|nr:hypothetical protein [Anaerolineae bacterium]